MYSTERVVSADMPCSVRKSSMEVRKNCPLIKNSNGIGEAESRRLLTRVERA